MKAENELQARVDELEAALQEDRRVNTTIFDTTAALIVVLDRQGNVVQFNRACEEATGYTFEEVHEKPLWDFFTLPEERASVRAMFGALDAGMFPSQYENDWLTKDGSRILVAWSNTAVVDDAGEVEYVVATGTDITERAQTEQQLATFQAIVENSLVGIFIVDAKARVIYANRTLYQLLGCDYESQELIGQDGTRYLPEEELPRLTETILPQAMAGGWQGIVQQKRKDGTLFDASITIFPMRDAKGQPVGMVVSVRDITGQRLMEQKLRDSESEYRLVLEHLPDNIVRTDRDGKIEFANRGFPGFEPEQLVGMNIVDLTLPDHRAQVHETLARVRAGELTYLETTFPGTEDRETTWRANRGIPIMKQGQVVGMLSISSDITAQRRAQVEHEQLQRDVIEAQQRALRELSTPIIPVMEGIIVMPLVGSVDSRRAKETTRALLAGITQYRAKIVILDITGVPLVDSGVADHLNKAIQAARLKGVRVVVTGISDSVAETVVDLGIDWSSVNTLRDLQTGLVAAIKELGVKLG